MNRVERYLMEMAKADMEGIDLSSVAGKSAAEVSPKTVESIVQKYFENYKTRTKKEISPQAIPPFKKLIAASVTDEALMEKFMSFAKLLVVKKVKEPKEPKDVKVIKPVEESVLEEMAAADLKDIDLENDSPKTLVKKYIKNYKERTQKEFTAQAAAALKKALADSERDDIDEIVKLAREEGGVKEAKSHSQRSKESNEKRKEAEAEKKDTMSKNVADRAKEAHDIFKTMKESIQKNSGLISLEEAKCGKGKTAKCPICGEKYLVKTGYCLSCKKKVGAKKSDDEGDAEIKESSEEQTYMKDGVKVYRTDGVINYKGSEYKIPKEVVALKDLKK